MALLLVLNNRPSWPAMESSENGEFSPLRLLFGLMAEKSLAWSFMVWSDFVAQRDDMALIILACEVEQCESLRM